MKFLLVALLVSVCLAQSQDAFSANATPLANDTVNASRTDGSDINSAPAIESGAIDGVQMSVPASGKGIWKVSLGEDVITAAFNQSGESIFGLTKFEGDNPWNGAVAGSLSGDAISLSMASVEGGTVASTYMSGHVEGDSMKGYFIRSDSSGKATRGEFAATQISPDTSGYSPAAIQTVSAPVAEQQLIAEQSISTAPQPVPLQTESKFKDVTQLAGINPSILPRTASL
jgi:hypothetical protein